MHNLLSIKIYKLSILKKFVILFVTAFILSMVLSLSTGYVPRAYALDDKALQKAAEEYCGTSDAAKVSACRNGYREGAKGDKSKAQACGDQRDNPYKTDDEKKNCEKGYEAGKLFQSDPLTTEGFTSVNDGEHICGTDRTNDKNVVRTKFDFGCIGRDPNYSGPTLNPIEDMLYAVVRFLTAGVGVVMVIAIIVSGIQYSSSEGNPEASQAAKNRVRSTLIGLLFYIFAFAIIQYLVPGGVFN